jgi:hypothetical protein
MKQMTVEQKEAWIKELTKIMKRSKKIKRPHGNIKCDCGHPRKDHYNGGWCHDSSHKNSGACGCTWFHPNVKYIKRKKDEKNLVIRSKKKLEKSK